MNKEITKPESNQVISDDWEDRKGSDLAFMAKSLIVCSLPLQGCSLADKNHFTSSSNELVLTISGIPEYGIPYGADRLIYYWLITQAVRRKSKRIEFKSPHEILVELGKDNSGKSYRWLQESLQRIASSSLIFQPKKRNNKTVAIKQTNIIDHINLYCNDDFDKEEGNVICLSEDFYKEVTQYKGAIPLDFKVIRSLSNAPGAMDLYAFVCWRSYFLFQKSKEQVLIPYESLKDQFGVSKTRETRKFKHDLKNWAKKIEAQLKKIYIGDVSFPIAFDKKNLVVYPSRLLPAESDAFVHILKDYSVKAMEYINALPTSAVKERELKAFNNLLKDGYTHEQISISIDELRAQEASGAVEYKEKGSYLYSYGRIKDVLESAVKRARNAQMLETKKVEIVEKLDDEIPVDSMSVDDMGKYLEQMNDMLRM